MLRTTLFFLCLVSTTRSLHATTLLPGSTVIAYSHTVPSYNQYPPQFPSIADENGLPTGFTARLPGTGNPLTVPVNDGNITASPGDALEFRGQNGSLDQIDMPCVVFQNSYHGHDRDGRNYLYGDVSFTNVHIGANEEAGIFIGQNANNVFLYGMRGIDSNGDFKFFAREIVNGVATDVPGAVNTDGIHPSTDVSFYFERGFASPGDFLVCVSTLLPYVPNQGQTGAGESMPFASAPVLYAGVFVLGDSASIQIPAFELRSVPEPSTYGLGIAGALALGLCGIRRRVV